MKATKEKPSKLIGVRVTPSMFEVLHDVTVKDMQTTKQELIRAAIRDFLKREYPALWEKHVEKIK